ncbi:MAG: hypothetical protein ACFFCS_24490 [Candidatus Hodarchaeota archaeon]
MMSSHQDHAPDWTSIKSIIDDLQVTLDSLESINEEAPDIRMRLAQTIANLRAEKSFDDRINKLKETGFLDTCDYFLYKEPPARDVI